VFHHSKLLFTAQISVSTLRCGVLIKILVPHDDSRHFLREWP